MCAAAQEVREISDPGGARAFLGQHCAEPGQSLAWTGVQGGYSVLQVRVERDFSRIHILAGATALPRLMSGRRMLDAFVSKNRWVGPRIFGGARAIPLRRPYTRLVSHGVALLGDSACQVYATHGSGIGMGLVAGRILADTVSSAMHGRKDPGSPEALWGYGAAFHRRWGSLLGAADAFRRFTQLLSVDDIETLMGEGLITPSVLEDALGQRMPTVRTAELPSVVRGVLRSPGLAQRLLPVVARIPLIDLVASTYPLRDTPHIQVDLYRYERRMRWLVDSVEWL